MEVTKQSRVKILVTGASGQLGLSLRDLSGNYSQYDFHFKNSKELDITNKNDISFLFLNEDFDFCINCAAYTAVDKAEKEKNKAFLANAYAVKYLAEVCKKWNTVLIHVSTDFVFDGTKSSPYTINDLTRPINIYGESKLRGEQYIQQLLEDYFIIRTSWVYSEYGNNFLKTMLRLATENNEISVVNDQIGSPTYAGDLGRYIIGLINDENELYGIKNYTNNGIISWYDFAVEIFKQKKTKIKVNGINTEEYPTPAKRPKYSVLESRLMETIDWKVSLSICLMRLSEK